MSFCASGDSGVFARNSSHALRRRPPRPRPPPGRADHDEPIGAEGFLVEEVRAAADPGTPIAIRRLAGLRRERHRHRCRAPASARRASRLYGNGDSMPAVPPLAIQQPAARTELVPLGVAAEVVVVVEDQDARRRARARAIEVRRRQPADAAADDDEIVGLAGVDRLSRGRPESCRRAARATRRTIRRGCRACRSAPADSSRARPARRRGLSIASTPGIRRSSAAADRAADANRHAVQEIAPRDRTIHPESRSLADAVDRLISSSVLASGGRFARLNRNQPSAVGPTTPTTIFDLEQRHARDVGGRQERRDQADERSCSSPTTPAARAPRR